MVWAIPRIAPIRANLLFELQPANRRGYKFNLNSNNSTKPEKLEIKIDVSIKIKLHVTNTISKALPGAKKNTALFALAGQ